MLSHASRDSVAELLEQLLARFLDRSFCFAYVLSRQLASKQATMHIDLQQKFFAILFFHHNHLEGV
jgi:hypothetical protein